MLKVTSPWLEAKKAPANTAYTGIRAPQDIKGIRVIASFRLRSSSRVRVAIIAGTPQP
ncbi:hypothetical protein D3C76_1767340 [compost metagenome]